MSLPVFQRTIVTEAGDVIAGAEVEVVNEATGLAADIFSDRAGNTPRTNPFFTGADGFAQFFAAPAEYRITATGPTGSIVFRFVVLTNDAALMNNNTGGNTLNTLAAQNANSVNISGGAIASTNVTGGTVNPTTLQQGGSQAYVRSNILGTVSQSGSVPTGAIIQRGSNANGYFVMYADGTMICTHQLSLSGGPPDNNLKDGVWTFPISFISQDLRVYGFFRRITGTTISPAIVSDLLCSALNAQAAVIEIWAISGQLFGTGQAAMCDLQAIGRWF